MVFCRGVPDPLFWIRPEPDPLFYSINLYLFIYMEGCGHMGAVLICLGGKPKTSNLHKSKNRLKSFKICIFWYFSMYRTPLFIQKCMGFIRPRRAERAEAENF